MIRTEKTAAEYHSAAVWNNWAYGRGTVNIANYWYSDHDGEKGGKSMIAIVCLDDRNGMSFNCRRQSRDAWLCQKVLDMAQGNCLRMAPYSVDLFGLGEGNHIKVSDSFLEEAGRGDYVFVEDRALAPYAEKLEKLVIFRWNRVYPVDRYFDLDLVNGPLHKTEEKDFLGKSHKRITMEVYTR